MHMFWWIVVAVVAVVLFAGAWWAPLRGTSGCGRRARSRTTTTPVARTSAARDDGSSLRSWPRSAHRVAGGGERRLDVGDPQGAEVEHRGRQHRVRAGL